ncbi:PAS domain S-box-containing protein [Tranquillimonas alkanivorans]|uniref:histidine kinase n=2 Tax=Tranquillimonas alkanivorans TaxID=441119 RepID=A0A1I5US55_9RHOB|nr:PAS domain S-box-containing protein [Tranquillimonas alkanivorans]
MGEAFGLMDHDLRIITQNEAALALDGRSLEDIQGRTHWEVYPGSEESELGRLYKYALDEQVPVSLEHRYKCPHDGTKWLEMRAFPVPEGLAVFWRDISERKEAEAALRQSESRLRKVLDIETVGVVYFDLIGGALDANEAYLSMIGYSRAELEKGEVRYEHLTPPDWRWRDEQTIAEFGASGKAGPFEKQYFHRDGSRIWVLCSDKMLDDGTAVEIIIDVTERKRAEAALLESEQRYKTLFESMDEADAVVEVLRDDAGNWADFLFIEVNPAFMKHTSMPYPVGKRATELLGTPNPRWAETYGRVVDTGEAVRLEEEEPVLDRVFDLNIFRIGDASDRRVAVLFNDVTERKRGEAALRESEARYRALVGSTSDIIYRMSPDWTEMRELGGRGFITDTHEPRRDWMKGYIPPEDQPTVEAAIREAIITETPFDLEHRVWKVDGSIGWVRSRAVPRRDENGRLREWFGAASDVTSRRRAEERQNMLMGELDHRVKNTLAVVQSITRQSLGRRQAVGPETAERLVGRINALAQSHALLARSRWEGAGVADLVENTVAPYRSERSDRITVAGPDLQVTPKAAQTLTLAFHELVTNAGKYGALSRENGRLTIGWNISGEADDRRQGFRIAPYRANPERGARGRGENGVRPLRPAGAPRPAVEQSPGPGPWTLVPAQQRRHISARGPRDPPWHTCSRRRG